MGGACNTQIINMYNVWLEVLKRSIAKYTCRRRNNININPRIILLIFSKIQLAQNTVQ
jgi:hypothetical protein